MMETSVYSKRANQESSATVYLNGTALPKKYWTAVHFKQRIHQGTDKKKY